MIRSAEARWSGDLKAGKGQLKVASGAFAGAYSFISRFQGSGDTNPEELLGAAHAGCFSMALSNTLAQGGHVPEYVDTKAQVFLEQTGPASSAITKIHLVVRGKVAGLSAEEFVRLAEQTKDGCIISQALKAVPMTLDAELVAS